MSDDVEADDFPDDPELDTPDEGAAGGPKKRWFDRGLVWLAAVIVLAVVALAVSFLAADKEPTAAEVALPDNITEYCAAARALGEAPSPTIDSGDASEFIAYRDYLEAMRVQAPAAMAVRLQRIQDSFQPVIEKIEATSSDQIDTSDVGEALDAQGVAIADDASEVSDYTYRVCGFHPEDLATAPAGTPVDEPADQAPAPLDSAAFCAAARTFAEAPAPEAPLGGDASGYIAYRETLSALKPSAPPSIAQRVQNIVDSFEQVIVAIEASPSKGDQAFNSIADAMDVQEGQVATDSEQLQAYIRRICGFDTAEVHAAAQPTTTVTSADEPDSPTTTASASPGG